MKSYRVVGLLSILATVPLRADVGAGPGTTYHVEWPAIYLDGTFSLDVGPAFGTYFSTAALGTYGGLSGTYSVEWRSVKFSAQSDSAELDFVWDQGYTGYNMNPTYAGRSLPWTSADEAWQDLVAMGAVNGVMITIVPEPSVVALLCAGLISLNIFRNRISRMHRTPR